MMTDPVSDMLTQIRNANAIRKKRVTMPASRMRVAIAQVLKEEGFLRGYEMTPGKPSSSITLELSYGQDGEQVIRSIVSVSKPGCRVYASCKELAPVLLGQGIQVLSTNRGVMSDRRARQEKLGGEILAKIW